jgi:hypothetical protein
MDLRMLAVRVFSLVEHIAVYFAVGWEAEQRIDR